MDRYAAIADPYCYPGTTVLKNVPGLKSQAALDRFETALTAQRFAEPLPTGRLEHFPERWTPAFRKEMRQT